MLQVSASDFKTHCLHYMDVANQKHETVVITKRGKPVAKLIPYEEEVPELFGRMKGAGVICGDIIEPLDVDWDIVNDEYTTSN
jgi:prevent-host-death family protein